MNRNEHHQTTPNNSEYLAAHSTSKNLEENNPKTMRKAGLRRKPECLTCLQPNGRLVRQADSPKQTAVLYFENNLGDGQKSELT
jgi:hypothetical protein